MSDAPSPGDHIVVWFSCGAASAVAAHETIRRYGNDCVIRVVNNPVLEEDRDNRRFLGDVAQWLGVPIELARNTLYPDCSADTVWRQRRFMSGIGGAPCTFELKKEARRQWEDENRVDWHVLGFTSDEVHRFERFRLGERSNTLGVLIDAGITKADCFRRLLEAGIALPRVYLRGYPNANCIGCVKATSATYWNHVREQDPDAFEARARLSRELGARLVRCSPRFLPWMDSIGNGEWVDRRTGEIRNNRAFRVFLDELPAHATGAPMKGLDFECGIFCEERG